MRAQFGILAWCVQSDTLKSVQKRTVHVIYSDNNSNDYQILLSTAGIETLNDIREVLYKRLEKKTRSSEQFTVTFSASRPMWQWHCQQSENIIKLSTQYRHEQINFAIHSYHIPWTASHNRPSYSGAQFIDIVLRFILSHVPTSC